MASFWYSFTVFYSLFHLAVLQLECSKSHACLGDVIRCQCQDDQSPVLIWRVLRPGGSTPVFSSPLYSAESPVGSPTTMGDYSVILNSTDPISSQLTITLMMQEPELVVRCDTGIVMVPITLRNIEGTKATHCSPCS